jgi:hypothetical protein
VRAAEAKGPASPERVSPMLLLLSAFLERRRRTGAGTYSKSMGGTGGGWDGSH